VSALEVELPAGRGAPAMARRAVDGLADRLSEQERSTLHLLVSELVTNAVLHAGVADRDSRVLLHVTVAGGAIRVEVRDKGRGFTKQVPQPREEGHGGYGLFLVDKMAARWGVHGERGARVWFELDRAAS
jgi:anti-sigma regulatory factor (Ser/Thr protein kinase)